MENKNRKKTNAVRTVLICMLSFCVFACGAFICTPAYAGSQFKGSSPYSNTGRSAYYHNGAFADNLIVNGVDVSTWQSKNCNWDKAKAAGVDYAILRVTYTNFGPRSLKLNPDDKFQTHFSKARAAGVMTGVYVFSQAKNASEGIQEAEYAVKRLKALGIGPAQLQLPVYMDYEYAGGRLGRLYGVSRTNATNAAVAFCNTIKAHGYTPGIYASTSFFNKLIDRTKLAADVDIWAAQYYSRCELGGSYSKWQYSSSAKIDGVYNLAGLKGSTDVNFWYLNKTNNTNALTSIKGKTTLSVADAKSPKFTITRGGTALREGTDYITGGIRNNKAGSGYIYIKGIGSYSGYALIPIKVASKSSGSANQDLNGKCANYLTDASGATSSYVGAVASVTKTYSKGSTYTVNTSLNIRKSAGTQYAKVKRSKLSKSMKKKTYSGKYAVLKPGSRVKCKKVSGNWIKISGGWICCKSGDEVYVD